VTSFTGLGVAGRKGASNFLPRDSTNRRREITREKDLLAPGQKQKKKGGDWPGRTSNCMGGENRKEAWAEEYGIGRLPAVVGSKRIESSIGGERQEVREGKTARKTARYGRRP